MNARKQAGCGSEASERSGPVPPGGRNAGRTSRERFVGWGACLGAVLLALVLTGTKSVAQGTNPSSPAVPPTTYLTVTSDPPGAIVTLVGEYELVGTTPWNVFRPLSGIYRVQATAPGYGTWERTVVLGATGIHDLHIELPRKSRFGAAARSLVVPGWGQHYNEARGKRNLVWVTEAAALVAVYAFWERYQDRKDEFDDVAELYRDSRDLDAIPILRRELERRSERADDAFDHVEQAQWIAFGIYGLAFLDAFFSGPEEAGSSLGSRAALPEEGAETTLGWALGFAEREPIIGLRLSF